MASSAAVAAAASFINPAALPSPRFRFSLSFSDESFYVAFRLPVNLPFRRNSRFGSSALCFSRRRKHGSSPSQHAKPPQRKKQVSPKKRGGKEDELDEDAFEALFKQLEEDLKNDDPSFEDTEDDISEEDLARLEQELAEALGNDELQMTISNAEATGHADDDAESGDDDEEEEEDIEDDISEEDLARLEQELAEALGDDELQMTISNAEATGHGDDDAESGDDDVDDDDEEEEEQEDIEDDISEEDLARLEQELAESLADDELQMSISNVGATEHDDDAEVGEEDEDDMERPVELKRWQFRRLATALKTGRRKTSIKNLAAELCLERSVVLKLLRDPPPDLLMMSAMLPDEAPESMVVPENRSVELEIPEVVLEARETNTSQKVKVPLHVMLRTWSAHKRLKKAQVATLERVYRRTKRPTNAMISSIVHVTSVPRKRVIKWFEDKRGEDGVPDQRLPYERIVPDTAG